VDQHHRSRYAVSDVEQWHAILYATNATALVVAARSARHPAELRMAGARG
jgi:hypothetical protein